MRHHLHVLACAILAVAAVGLAHPATASAQNPQPMTQSAPPTTAPVADAVGKKVYVTTVDGRRQRGRLQTVTPDSITLAAGSARLQIAIDQVVAIKRESHRIRNGLLIGLAAGLGPTVAWIFNAEDGEEVMLSLPALGLAAGASLGVLHNYLRRDSDVLYDRRRKPTTTVSLAPIVSRTRKGIALSVSWR